MNTFLYHVSGRESALFAARQRYARSVHARQMLDARDDDDESGGGGRRACLSTVALKDGEREKGAREREKEADVFASVSKRTQVHFVGRVRRDARNVPILVRPLSTSL